jgi:hypothetical protein
VGWLKLRGSPNLSVAVPLSLLGSAYDHIDLMAAAAGAYEPGAPIEHRRCGAVSLGHLGGVGLDRDAVPDVGLLRDTVGIAGRFPSRRPRALSTSSAILTASGVSSGRLHTITPLIYLQMKRSQRRCACALIDHTLLVPAGSRSMPELKSADTVYLLIAFVVPGLIIVFTRGQMTTGRIAPHKEAMLTYFVLSLVYYSAILPFLIALLQYSIHSWWTYICWLLVIFVIPFELGILLGLQARFGWFRAILSRMRLPTSVHALPTAWDYKFSNVNDPVFVLITLKNDGKVAGFLNENSFISSEQTERDIYLDKVYDLDDNFNWIENGGQGLLIASGEISTIQFWANENQGEVHGA